MGFVGRKRKERKLESSENQTVPEGGATATHTIRQEHARKVPDLEKHDTTGRKMAETAFHLDPRANYVPPY